MIAAAMVYTLTITLLLTLAALAAERILAVLRWPRRGLWVTTLVTSLAIPSGTLLLNQHNQLSPAFHTETSVHTPYHSDAATAGTSAAYVIQSISLPWPVRTDWDAILGKLWVAMSAGTLLLLAVLAWRITRFLRGLPVLQMNGESVFVAEHAGPAAFGFLNPRIIFPRNLLEAPASVRSIILRHERSHIAARDPMLLVAALLPIVLTPWNLPLWWQLRRLRFAIEVDCDARVVREVDPVTYGETLLAIGQYRASIPLGIALTETIPLLERRIQIIMFEKPRHYAVLASAFSALTLAFVACAAQMQPPTAISETSLGKPPPGFNALGPRFEALLQERYPQLLRENIPGVSMVFVLFGANAVVEQTHLELSGSRHLEQSGGRPEDFTKFQAAFNRYFGIAPEEVAYMGEQGMLAPVGDRHNKILVLFTERKLPNEAFVSTLASNQDTRDIDHQIAEHYFKRELQQGVVTGERLWVLLDSQGRILRSGKEPAGTDQLNPVLEARYPGIKTEQMTVTPVTDRALQPLKDANGNVLQLHSVWLTSNSQQPQG